MIIIQVAHLIVDSLRQVWRQASSRHRLLAQQPALARNLPFSVFVDEESRLGSNPVLQAGAAIYGSSLGDKVSIGKNSQIRTSTLGSHSAIGPNSTLQRARVGDHSYLTGHSFLQLTTIGKFCSIAANFTCGYGNHPTNMLSTHPAFFTPWTMPGGVTFADKDYFAEGMPASFIGNDVWCGANVFIKSGVTIGDGAIVAAGAIVVRDVAPYTIVGGVPAVPLRMRFSEEEIAILLKLQWWNWPMDVLAKATPLIRDGDVRMLQQWADTQSILHQNQYLA